MTHPIEISYSGNPLGQVGPRPHKMKKNDKFRLTTNDPGVLTIEFIGQSPVEGGGLVHEANHEHKVVKTGRFQYICILDNNGKKVVLDPRNPATPGGGGELEVEPEG